MDQTSGTWSNLVDEPALWKGCEATRLANGVMEIICLMGGGHLASLRLIDLDGHLSVNALLDGHLSVNALWEAPWIIQDPLREWSDTMTPSYGPLEIGRFLASYTGHVLCLDYFGAPSKKSIAAGLSLHGEAAITRWNVQPGGASKEASCSWQVKLPVTQLTFEREIRLGNRQSVAYVRERVINERDIDHRCDWVQHLTFGPPLLWPGESTVVASGMRGFTGASYGSLSLLTPESEFEWPYAHQERVDERADLTQPFSRSGYGCLAGVQMDPKREQQFILAANWRLRLGICYCFRRCDFPWMTVWEENCTRREPPWNGTTMARGMEFGTCPLPFGEERPPEAKEMFGETTGCVIPARATRSSKYLITIFSIPDSVRSIQDAAAIGDAIVLYNEQREAVLSIPADGCQMFLTAGDGSLG